MTNRHRAKLLAAVFAAIASVQPLAAEPVSGPTAALPIAAQRYPSIGSLAGRAWDAIADSVAESEPAQYVKDTRAWQWAVNTLDKRARDKQIAANDAYEQRIATDNAKLVKLGYDEGQIVAIRAFADDEARQLSLLDDPDNGVFEQGARVADGRGFTTGFKGFSIDGSVNYDGRRRGGYLIGNYSTPDGAGSFAGAITRSNQVTGTYVQGKEIGVFSGRATADLSQIFDGVAACKSGCPPE